MPNQSDPNSPAQPTVNPPAPAAPTDTPPIIPDFQDIPSMPTGDSPQAATEKPDVSNDSSSSAPPDIPPIISTTPKKKFGGGKIIATILGFLILVGGIAGGVILTQQQQDVRELAGACCTSDSQCGSGNCMGAYPGHPCDAVGEGVCGPCFEGSCPKGKECKGGQCKLPDEGGGTTQECQPNTQTVVSCTTAEGCPGDQTKYCDSTGYYSGAQGLCAPKAGLCPTSCNPFNQVWDPVQKKCVSTSDSTATQCTAGQDCNVPSSAQGAVQCSLNGVSTYCCPANVTYDQTDCILGANECSGTGACTSNGVSGTCINGACVTSNTSCKVGDPNAPGCCADTVNCAGEIVCEPSAAGGRKECKLPSGQHCTMAVGSSSGCGGSGGNGDGGPTAQCQNIKAYTVGWTLLSASQLAQLEADNQVNFCVAGTTTDGTFSKGKFTINGAVQNETSTKRPGSNDFCQLYTIPTGTTTFSVSAQIYHSTLGWK